MKDTKIEWADNTINFYMGCSKISPGCKNCYMFRLEERFGRDPTKVRKTNWNNIERNLKKWEPSKIFVNSMSDTFHESINDDEITEIFRIMHKYPQHQYLILTKRINRAREYFSTHPIRDNFWIGASVETNTQKYRIEVLGKIQAKIRFVSFEPLLGYIDIKPVNCFEWAIIGGESGYDPRLMEKPWVDKLIDQLKEKQIPTFFKQWGGSFKCKCHGAYGCRLIEGKTLDEMPI